MSKTPRDEKWGTKRACAAYLGVARVTFQKIVDSGAVTVRQYPGVTPQYLWADVERLALDCVKPARSA